MAIRITGMYSGLDTESIISQLASAQSVKKNKLVKEQTKLSWKQDAWKALNTKIYSFYNNVLDNMRWQGSYMKKSTKVSNSNAVSVIASSNAPNSVQTMKISQLAKSGNMTGAKISGEDGKQLTSSSTLKDLGFAGEGSFRVKIGGKTTDITVDENTKISEVVNKLQSAGVNASFDQKNQRFYINAKSSGAAADFTITSNNGGGQNALAALGLVSAYNKDSAEYKEYALWASYSKDFTTTDEKRDAAMKAEIEKLIAAKKNDTDSRVKANEELQKRIDALLKDNEENSKYSVSYDPDKSVEENAKALEENVKALLDKVYGPEHKVQKTDEDGNPVVDDDGNPVYVQKTGADGKPMVDENGDPVWEMTRDGGLKKDMDDAAAALKTAQEKLAKLKEDGASQDEIAAAEAEVTAKSELDSNARKAYNDANGELSFAQAMSSTVNAVKANNEAIADNKKYYKVDANGDPDLDEDGNLQADAKAKEDIEAYFKSKIEAAEEYIATADQAIADGTIDKEKFATKVDGQDAKINLNGVEYTNSNNTFEINGLTITAQQETDEEITLTTSEDTDGIYDMIKNFFTEYNKLINEMSSLYNAESSKGYEPLLSEEKAELADSEIEEWEKKIKDSLLRRDSTLRDVSDAVKETLLRGTTVNGKTMYLSDFGINTLGYFNAADNEKSAYHINGDKDDANVANEDDVLRQMIATQPDTVMNFFSSMAENLHNTLQDKMKAVKDTSSAFTVYNDKLMQKEYDDYKSKISKEETKLNALMDKYYAKFSAMETAMAKLQSKSNAVAGMLGGG